MHTAVILAGVCYTYYFFATSLLFYDIRIIYLYISVSSFSSSTSSCMVEFRPTAHYSWDLEVLLVDDDRVTTHLENLENLVK